MNIQEFHSHAESDSPSLITGKALGEMGDIGPCELVEGRIVKTSFATMLQGRLLTRILRYVGNFVEAQNLGEVMVGEVGLYTQHDPDTVRAADLLFISHERLAKATPGGFLDVAPELIVEILSPSDRWVDVRKKLREYFEIGVMVVLVVEPEEQVISIYRSTTDVQELSLKDMLNIEDVLPGFTLVLADLFS